MQRDSSLKFGFAIIVAFLMVFAATGSSAEELTVEVDKTISLRLDRPATVVSVANAKIADVNVLSPRVLSVTGKAIGETSIVVLHRKNSDDLRSYNISVTPADDNQVTVNLGGDAVKTLKCQPRCVQISNPGKDPEPGKGGGGGGAAGGGSAGGGLLSGGGKK